MLKRIYKKIEELSEEVKPKFTSTKFDFEGSYDDLLSSMSHKDM
jgi:hypothetical protein